MCPGEAHGGVKNFYASPTTSRLASIRQIVSVSPNTNYVFTLWVKSTGDLNEQGAEVGVRDSANSVVLSRQYVGQVDAYSMIRVEFNSGSNISVNIYFGRRGAGDGLVADDASVSADLTATAPNLAPPPNYLDTNSHIATVSEESAPSISTAARSQGDLWPSCSARR